tara:strand:+ start:471 stop:881 length:411 start_codon:yes stop_codon:yes gene_type:complete
MSDKLPRQPRDKQSGLPKKYVAGLSKEDKKKQVESIKKGKDRPKLKSAPPSKRSSHVEKFEKKYGYKISNTSRISKEIISKTGIDKILSKGRGAYYSQGSRPNTTPEQWARARLASVIMGGNARKVDKAIWEKYKK